MTDLYRTLGIKPSAGLAEIRRAYRKLAKSAHPDTGGDRAQFDNLKLAHDVLTNEKRRAHYDKTGEVLEQHADNAMRDILTVIAQAFDTAAKHCIDAKRDFVTVDFVEGMTVFLTQQQTNTTKQIEALEKGLAQMRRIVGRFTKRVVVKICSIRWFDRSSERWKPRLCICEPSTPTILVRSSSCATMASIRKSCSHTYP